jgi:hypothetical protein
VGEEGSEEGRESRQTAQIWPGSWPGWGGEASLVECAEGVGFRDGAEGFKDALLHILALERALHEAA